MKQGRKQFFDHVIDIPEGTSGKVTIRHLLKPAGTKLRSGTLRTAMFGQKDKEITYPEPTRWHELSEDDHGVWMTDLPIEQKQMDALIEKAHGRVLVGGLGVGYAVVALAQKPRVKSITVVEHNADVIKLVWDATMATVAKQAKVPGRVTCEIVHADLFDYLKQRTAFFQWGLFDIWQSDGEHTFHTTVVPLRKLADGMVRQVECWNEDIMRGQLMQGLHSRMFLLKLPQVEGTGDWGLSLDALCEDTDNVYMAWAVPFWRWYRDHGQSLDHDTLNYAMQRYVICYGQPGLDVMPILQHLTNLYGKKVAVTA